MTMATATTREWLRGAVVAVPTPFHDDFSLDLDSLGENVELPTPTLMAELAELFERAELPRVGAGVTA
jgi:hypothetical protein